jgi:hypothetical protein
LFLEAHAGVRTVDIILEFLSTGGVESRCCFGVGAMQFGQGSGWNLNRLGNTFGRQHPWRAAVLARRDEGLIWFPTALLCQGLEAAPVLNANRQAVRLTSARDARIGVST